MFRYEIQMKWNQVLKKKFTNKKKNSILLEFNNSIFFKLMLNPLSGSFLNKVL